MNLAQTNFDLEVGIWKLKRPIVELLIFRNVKIVFDEKAKDELLEFFFLISIHRSGE